MSGSTTASERLLKVSNKLWDAMYESGEVPTYAERAHYYLALKDTMDENVKLRELVDELYPLADYGAMDASELDRAHDLMRKLGIEVDE